MNKRKPRRHFSGTANLQLSSQLSSTTGETFFDSMRRTMTQSLSKPLPSIAPKYGDPIVIDPRNTTLQKFPKKKVISNIGQSRPYKPNFQNREESYKNDIQQTKPILFDNNQFQTEKLKNIQKLLRRKYATRNKMFNIFNGWDGEPKGYISPQNLRSVFQMMGVHLSEKQSVDFIRLHSPNETKLNLNSFLNIIYSPQNDLGTDSTLSTFQPIGDDRFKNNFNSQQYDCSNLKMQNINKLDAYHLQKALFDGQKIKNKLQKYLKTADEAKEQLFNSSQPTIKFDDIKNKLITFLKQKEGNVKWRELQGFLSLHQYNINQQLNIDAFCNEVFDNNIILQKNFIYKNSTPIKLQNRFASNTDSNFYSFQPLNIQKCLKKIDQQIFRSSITSDNVFHKFDKDKDGFVSEDDFVKTMIQHNLLNQNESKRVFQHLGGKNGEHNSCFTFKEFSQKIRPGMGTQESDQYPNFLRPKRIDEFRATQRFTKSHYFNPLSTQNKNQRKTRFNGTPNYCYSTLGADGTKFWGKSGDLNAKIDFQKQQKHRLNQNHSLKIIQIARNRQADQKRKEFAQDNEQIKFNNRLLRMGELKASYEKINHRF